MFDARDMPRSFAFPHSIKITKPETVDPVINKSDRFTNLKHLWKNESGKLEIKLPKGNKPGWLWEQRIQREYKMKEGE
jgi:hypothetical protein